MAQQQKKQKKISKPGGGWASDSDDENKQDIQIQFKNQKQGDEKLNKNEQFIAKGQGSQYVDKSNDLDKIKQNKLGEFQIIPLDDLKDSQYEHENQVILDNIQPGGARLKQSDKSLDQFSKACESLNLQTISSILLHYIHSESQWQIKAKAFFLIECLIKSQKKYQNFFKNNLSTLKDSNSDENSQLQQIKENVIALLETINTASVIIPQKKKNIEPNMFINENFEQKDTNNKFATQTKDQNLVDLIEIQERIKHDQIQNNHQTIDLLLDDSAQVQPIQQKVQQGKSQKIDSFSFLKAKTQQSSILPEKQNEEQQQKSSLNFIKQPKTNLEQELAQKAQIKPHSQNIDLFDVIEHPIQNQSQKTALDFIKSGSSQKQDIVNKNQNLEMKDFISKNQKTINTQAQTQPIFQQSQPQYSNTQFNQFSNQNANNSTIPFQQLPQFQYQQQQQQQQLFNNNYAMTMQNQQYMQMQMLNQQQSYQLPPSNQQIYNPQMQKYQQPEVPTTKEKKKTPDVDPFNFDITY